MASTKSLPGEDQVRRRCLSLDLIVALHLRNHAGDESTREIGTVAGRAVGQARIDNGSPLSLIHGDSLETVRITGIEKQFDPREKLLVPPDQIESFFARRLR